MGLNTSREKKKLSGGQCKNFEMFVLSGIYFTNTVRFRLLLGFVLSYGTVVNLKLGYSSLYHQR